MSERDDLIALSDDEMRSAHRMQESADTAAIVAAIDALRLVLLAAITDS